MWSQVGLRKHHYEQSWWRGWNSSWAISNPERWCCESTALNMQQIWKTQQWPQDWKRSVFIPIPKKGNAKECSNYHTAALISHASKVMLKILQARLQQYLNVNFQMFKLVLEKTEEPEIKLPTIRWIIEKGRYFQKNIYFCFIDCVDHKIKPFDCVDHSKLENSERDGNTRPPDPPLEKPVYRSGSNS